MLFRSIPSTYLRSPDKFWPPSNQSMPPVAHALLATRLYARLESSRAFAKGVDHSERKNVGDQNRGALDRHRFVRRSVGRSLFRRLWRTMACRAAPLTVDRKS